MNKDKIQKEKYLFGLITGEEFKARDNKMSKVIKERQRQAAKTIKKSSSEEGALNV